MTQHAFIKLMPKSTQQTITLAEIKDLFHYYKNITAKTGDQVNWNYGEAAFPYVMNERTHNDHTLLELVSNEDRYNHFYVGVKEENDEHIIFLSLPENATFGDKGKANEFCRFLAKKLQGQLHLFNGRIMYFYKR
ncbi:DUF1885 family protein [Priestia taiwanensis]|uniref:DUF1885 family protein n=1 Tax=Priestia taiwanensis TaxID=1347902 RepID=A0A917AQG6_9BACI|nr:DUF1885 family protein [Priestia taiwanensis]MBM7363009.1 hypothetical protein [Priestia taiwanensis]GGE66893.1 hypothetical protein GCM10007140_16310 [Priestia taiwanensis]